MKEATQTQTTFEHALSTQTSEDFKHAVLITSLLINAATLTVWLVYTLS